MNKLKAVVASPIQDAIWRQRKLDDAGWRSAYIAATGKNLVTPEEAQHRLEKCLSANAVLRFSWQSGAGDVLLAHASEDAAVEFNYEDWSDLSRKQQNKSKLAVLKSIQQRTWSSAGLQLTIAKLDSEYSWYVLQAPSVNVDNKTLLMLLNAVFGFDEINSNIDYADVSAWLNEFQTRPDLRKARSAWSKSELERAVSRQLGLRNFKHEAGEGIEFDKLDVSELVAAIENSVITGNVEDLVYTSLRQMVAEFSDGAMLTRSLGSRAGELANVAGPLERAVAYELNCDAPLKEATQNEFTKRAELLEVLECFSKQEHAAKSMLFVFEYLDLGEGHDACYEIDAIDSAHENYKLCFGLIKQGKSWYLHAKFDRQYISSFSVDYFLRVWYAKVLAALTDKAQDTVLQEVPAGELKQHDADVNQLLRSALQNADAKVVAYSGGERQQLDYPALDKESNKVARALVEAGIGAGDIVALHVERGINFIVALLATVKAGAAWLPLDLSNPRARNEQILNACAPAAVLYAEAQPELEVLAIDINAVRVNGDASPVDRNFDHVDLAYVLFTSGSTGQPKGVQIGMAALMNHMAWMINAFGFSNKDCFLHRTSTAFDASVWEIWAPLLLGADLVITPDEAKNNPQVLKQVVAENAITVIQSIPSLADLYMDADVFAEVSSIKQFFLGGEALKTETADRLKALLACEVVNLYGPTECCIQVSSYRYQAPLKLDYVPIGAAIDNVRFIVLDEKGNKVGPGQTGELLVSGACLFKGYYAQSELTSQATKTMEGKTWYRTGDVVQVLHDGTLYYLDRKDDQIKYNGNRLELQEIANYLVEQKQTGSAYAAFDKTSKQIHLFLIGPKTPIDALRRFIADHFPEYMLPAGIHTLNEFPRLSNGKINKIELLQNVIAQANKKYEAPQTPDEIVLFDIWRELMGNSNFGIDTDFYNAGGDSLLAMKLANRVSRAFGIQVKMGDLFKHKTIRTFARFVKTQQTKADVIKLDDFRNTRDALSFTQKRLWFLNELEGSNAIYNVPATFSLSGELDASALEKSVNTIIQRHQVLRTNITNQNGEPHALVHASRSVALSFHDLCALTDADKEESINALQQAEASFGFDLSKDLLLRLVLAKTAEKEHVMIINMHHMVSDGWSSDIFIRELSALYNAQVNGEEPGLPQPDMQYADYAAWQARCMETETYRKQRAFWKQSLQNAPAVHSLPLDKPRPQSQSFNGKTLTRAIAPFSAARIDRFCANHKVTLFSFLQSLFAVFVSRYSGVDDVVMGTPSAGRQDACLENLIGCFVNTTVLRNKVDSEQPFNEFLEVVDKNLQLAQENQDVPFDVIVEDLEAGDRSLSVNPVFQLMIVQENGFSNSLALTGVRSAWRETENNFTKFDLILGIYRAADGFSLSWTYNTDLFNAETIEQFAKSYQTLLEAVLNNAQSRIAELPLLDAEVREHMQAQQTALSSELDCEQTLSALIEEQVKRVATKPALSDGQQALSYQQVDELGNRLASALTEAGVQAGDVVGVCMERGALSVLALVALLKAGAVYLPLDPARKAEQLQALLDESRAKLVLGDKDYGLHTESLTIDSISALQAWPTDYTVPVLNADMPACLIYTSGSSGKPKGVVLSHRGLVNRIKWMATLLPAQADDVFAQKTSLNFVDHLAEILQPLCEGALCEVIADAEMKDLTRLQERIANAKVTRLTLVPSMLRALLDQPGFAKAAASIRCLISSGEVLSAELAAKATNTLPQARIFNLYGSTEVSADALWCEYSEESCARESVAVGRPIANMRAYILDTHGYIQPPGVSGELYLSGPGLALSCDAGEKKASDFCCYPGIENGTRLYRTGDQCVRDSRGDIHYLGRNDNQIKVRGMRLDATEIEGAFYQLSSVKEVAVGSVGEQLVAWLVADIAEDQHEDEWLKAQRQQLKLMLADYMIPDSWVLLASLPRTQTGKLNRRLLPAPTKANRIKSNYVAPRTVQEKELCQIWQELLQLPQVGIEDNFFVIGGHSLLAARLVSRLRQSFKVQLSLKVLFANPTIAELVQHFDEAKSQEQPPQMQRVERAAKYELSYAQERLWFLNQLDSEGSEYNLPMRFSVFGDLNRVAMQQALDAIVARHEILRTVIIEEKGKRFQQVRSAQPVVLTWHDIRSLPVREQQIEVGRITREDARRAFDLSSDQLVRAYVFNLANAENVIFINIHHIAADGWSLDIFYREFNALYDAFSEGGKAELPALAYQYKDFAHWQRTWLQGAVLEKEITYWRSQLAGLPMVHSLPLDKARPPRLRQQGKVICQSLEKVTLEKIHNWCQQRGVTLFMFLHSALSVLFSRYSRDQDIVIGTPIAGRSQSDMGAIIGHFVNTLVLRSRVDGALCFEDLVLNNREMILAAFEHQNVPFEILVDKLNPVRSLSHSPLFQIMLTLQNNKQHNIQLKGLEKRGGMETMSAAKFDLELIAEEYNERLFIDWVYNVDLFEAETIERFGRSFTALVDAILEEEQLPIARLPIQSAAEKALILENWNETAMTYNDVARLENLFRKSAENCPDKIAVKSVQASYCYAELEKYSDRLCIDLQKNGVKHGDRVGVYMQRSAETTIAILAVLKAGAVYVALDPEYPLARLQYIIEDSDISTLISTDASELMNQIGVTTLVISDVLNCEDQPDESGKPDIITDVNVPACVVYTSGSTGDPKGVVLSHAGFANRICWMRNTFPAAAGEVYCQKTSLNFVDHVAEIFQPLSEGLSSVVVADREVKDVLPLLNELHEQEVTRITLVPSFLKVLLEHEEFRSLNTLKFIISSGETLADNLAEAVRERLPQVRLLNLYGSTEVSADVSYHLTSSQECEEVMQYFAQEDEFTYRGDENNIYKIPLAHGNSYTTPDASYEQIQKSFTNFKMPDTSEKIGEYIENLNRDVIPFAVNVSSSQYIGHMTSLLPNFMQEFSRLVTILNQNLVKMETSKSLTFLERQAIAMVHREFFELSDADYEHHVQAVNSNFGLVVSGGTSANITALLSARNKGLFKLGYSSTDLREKGASKLISESGMQDGVIICSKLAHYSVKKAANILGIGEQNIIALEQSESQRACVKDLKAKLEYCRKNRLFVIAVIGIAGATETGTIDPLPTMASLAAEYDVHFHVDAAWGGTFRFSSVYKRMLKGIERADSITFCAHKQLYLPQGISICLFRDPVNNGLLSTHSRYQAQAGSYDSGQYTIEGSRPATALFLHAALHLLSRQGYSWLLERSMENTRFFKRLIENSDAFELVGKPDMNIINYRYIPEALRGKKYRRFNAEENELINRAVDDIQWKQFLDGKTFVSKTSLNVEGVSDEAVRVFRVVLSNPAITKNDFKAVLVNQLEIAASKIEQADYNLQSAVSAIETFSEKNETETVPIGKPISNTKILLLDDAMQLVPIGVKGDVYVSGPGLALGYQNQDLLTSERFVVNPWDKQHTKMFKTGDVARWLENGEMQYVGRSDNCVKVRGALVDLIEVELLVSQLESIEEVAVLAAKIANDDLQMIAYLVAPAVENERELANSLRSQLKEKVPSYMIPEYFVLMDALPKTTSGKINRKLLPLPSLDQAARGEFVAPTNALEEQICEIWKKVLKINKLGIRDCFFEIGGHSLLAMTMLNRLKESLGVRIMLRDIFEYSTVEDLASLISTVVTTDSKDSGASGETDRSDDIELII